MVSSEHILTKRVKFNLHANHQKNSEKTNYGYLWNLILTCAALTLRSANTMKNKFRYHIIISSFIEGTLLSLPWLKAQPLPIQAPY